MNYGVLFYRSAAILILALSFTLAAHAQDEQQTFTFEFSGEKLTSALEKLAGASGMHLIYDPEIVRDVVIYRRVRNQQFDDALRSILTETGLDFIILSSGTYVVVKSSQAEPAYGSFSGKIVDAETGEPLLGATVMLADASGGTATGLSGHFTINRMISGNHEIIFSYVGYRPIRKVIRIDPEANLNETIRLIPAQVDFSPVVVSAHMPVISAHRDITDYKTSLSDWQAGRLQGPVKSLELFPGVQYGIGLTDLHIQGGQPGTHRFFLDGAPVYNPYSFGRLFSAFSPYSINRVSVDKAGFGAGQGSFISGKVNLSHDVSNSSGQNVLAQADPLNMNLYSNVGHSEIGLGDTQFMAAFRSSFWDMHQDAGLIGAMQRWDLVDPLTYGILTGDKNDGRRFSSVLNDGDVNFYDLHLAAAFSVDEYHSFNASLYTGRNAVETDLLARDAFNTAPVEMFSRDSYEWDNLVTQASWNWLASPRARLNTQASYSSNRMRHSYAMFDNQSIRDLDPETDDRALFGELQRNIGSAFVQRDVNEIDHFILKTDLHYSFSPKLRFSGGLQADFVESLFELSELFYLPTSAGQSSVLLSGFLESSWTAAPGLTLSAGSRITTINGGSNFFAEPRASVQYDQHESAIGYWSVKLSGGLYRQFINQFDITNVGPSTLVPNFTIWAHDNSLDQPKSWNSTLSFYLEPTRSTTIRTEFFYKNQPKTYITSYQNLMVGDPDLARSGLSAFAEITDSYAYGGSLRVKQSLLNSRLNILAGYDLTISEVNMESQFGGYVPTAGIDPHRIQGRILAHITPVFSVVGNWQAAYGRTWGFRQAYYDFMLTHNVSSFGNFDFTNPANDRLSPFHQVDVGFIYRPKIGRANAELRLDLINVLNRENEIDWNIMQFAGSDEFEIRSRVLPGFTPSVSIAVGF